MKRWCGLAAVIATTAWAVACTTSNPNPPADDPCDVAGTWTNGCPSVNVCGASCGGAAMNLAYQFTLSPQVAADGGSWTVGSASLTFEVATCTLTVSGPYCTPWSDDEFTLQNGTGTGTAYAHCRTPATSSCECVTPANCNPVRL